MSEVLDNRKKWKRNPLNMLYPVSNPLVGVFSYYLFFCLTFIVFHYSLISLVAFFHFLLGHQLSAISDWTLRYGWEILSLAKILAIFIALKVFQIRSAALISWKSFCRPELYFSNYRIFATLIYMFIFAIWLGQPILIKEHFNAMCLWFQGLSFLGSILFYSSDVLILYLARILYPLQKTSDKLFFILISAILCLGLSLMSIPYVQKINFFLVMHLISCLILFELKKAEIGFSLLYILFFIAPLNAFFGLDPIWGHTFSIFRMEMEIPSYFCIGLWGMGFIYLYYFEKRNLKEK